MYDPIINGTRYMVMINEPGTPWKSVVAAEFYGSTAEKKAKAMLEVFQSLENCEAHISCVQTGW
jgi:hypothetical protein